MNKVNATELLKQRVRYESERLFERLKAQD